MDTTTKDDKKREAAFAIRDMLTELKQYKVTINNAIEMLATPGDSSQNRKNQGIKDLKQLLNFIFTKSKATLDHIKILDPIASLDYAHNYLQRYPQILQETVRVPPIVSPPIVSPPLAPMQPTKRKSAAVLPLVSKKRVKPSPGIIIPLPANGLEYTQLEVLGIITKVPKEDRSRRSQVVDVIEKHVPVLRDAINRLVRKHEVNNVPLSKFDKPWNAKGRSLMLSPAQVLQAKESIDNRPGMVIYKEDVQTRDSEHKKGATSKSRTKTNFYRSYPSRNSESTKSSDTGRSGWFENLQQYVGIGINKNCEDARCLIKDVEEGGVFCFDKDTRTCIDKLNYKKDNNRVSIRDKQKDMLGYLWELAYDLCIAPSNNVSESPGFEHPLGVHARGPRKS